MLTSEFDFDLPDELVAQHPRSRGSSRLMLLPQAGPFEHRKIEELPEILMPGDLVVVNNTRVLAARLFGRLPTGGRIEILLVEKHGHREWDCLARPGRKARPGADLRFSEDLFATVIDHRKDGCYRLRFSTPPEEHLESLGHVPLPPYIKRPDDPQDRERYQTVYAKVPGAIAAPTAGLHFSSEILAAFESRGIDVTELTLHVGIGTFKPVTAELVHEHQMDAERFHVSTASAKTIQEARNKGGRIVAVGTTVVRTLEAIAARNDGAISPARGTTDLFITPGYHFRAVDVLLTNFHLPKSTLLMLVSAFGGRERLFEAYVEAISRRYRFYSYGDAMLIDRQP